MDYKQEHIKIVFLDIDGVLNSEEFYEGLPYKKYDSYLDAGYTEEQAYGMVNLDSVPIAKLNYLISQTGVKIVVSSSWRGRQCTSRNFYYNGHSTFY